jgi:hypothetical protein
MRYASAWCGTDSGTTAECEFANVRQVMTSLEEVKRAVVATIRDEEVASSTCYEVDAFAKLWPFVFIVNDWDVWNESKTALRLQVIRWLEEKDVPYTFYQFHRGYGLVGFKDQEAATDFDLQWSEESRERSGSDREWNPHPLKSTFEPHYSS